LFNFLYFLLLKVRPNYYSLQSLQEQCGQVRPTSLHARSEMFDYSAIGQLSTGTSVG